MIPGGGFTWCWKRVRQCLSSRADITNHKVGANRMNACKEIDIALIGAGIMSTTLAVLVKELQPDLNIVLFEQLEGAAQESSAAWNNAGTGHAANCELNYTTEGADGKIDLTKALKVNGQFDLSRQFWSYLVSSGAIATPDQFIHAVPHMSFVTGDAHQAFLKKRHATMSEHHAYQGMEYSEDAAQLADWIPLVMTGRDPAQPVAATRMMNGSDVNYGALTAAYMDYLSQMDGFSARFCQKLEHLSRLDNGRWALTLRDQKSGETHQVEAGYVFLGAGGGALSLLQKSHIPESKGYAGFPVSGQWLRCSNPEVVNRHMAKVYGMAATGAPPMSVPHLDTRIIDGEKWVLFGPYAGFTTRFLKHGSLLDLPASLRPSNFVPLLAVAHDNFPLEEYLVGQVLQTQAHRLEALKEYYPQMEVDDWELSVAGQRVQIVHRDRPYHGRLQFGTEVVHSSDGRMTALLGASPGASTAVAIMVEVLEHSLGNLLHEGWPEKLKHMIPSYGVDLSEDAAFTRRIRSETAEVLGLNG
nr:malate dehydrogenase (quinone) [Ruegeria sp. ANG-R]